MDKSKTSIQRLTQGVNMRVHGTWYICCMTQTIMFNRTSDLMQSVPQQDHVV